MPGPNNNSTATAGQEGRGLGAQGLGAAALAVASPLPRDVNVSFEFFPPKTEQMEQTLWTCVERLAPLAPSFVSVTYGAGGTTRERTHATVLKIRKQTDIKPAAHLTCVGASRDEVDAIAQRYWDEGIDHIVALRGDPAEDAGGYIPHPDGYAYASDLVAGLKKIGDFKISVAAYAETHPEAKSPEDDLDNLKRKIDAGATQAITQFFFDVDVYLRFLERVRAAGITVPIVPGILPVTNFARVVQFSGLCGATVPPWMADLFEGLDDDPETRKLVAATVAAEQCRVLNANGVKDFHFYTLNRADLTFAICRILGVKPRAATNGKVG
ncbi:MAG: methylenetetrahydrofolate reductase [Rhodospirillales bacterium]|nr:methylenetetrahydrofolate reductase [Rhodospirillales bacterium]